MKSLCKKLVTVSILLASQLAVAGSLTGKVIAVRVDATGAGIAYFNTNLNGAAACSSATYANAVAFNTNTVGGRSALATLLLARQKNSTIVAYGTGACAIYSGAVEDFSLLQESN